MKDNHCPKCQAEEYSPIRYDARGIPITRCCSKCWDKEKLKYRPEVLTDANYECDEDIEGD